MKYLVISRKDRDFELEATCDTYEEAFEELKDHFIDFQRDCGYSEKDLEKMLTQLDESSDLDFSDCGMIDYEGYACAWSDANPNYSYDIKIVVQ